MGLGADIDERLLLNLGIAFLIVVEISRLRLIRMWGTTIMVLLANPPNLQPEEGGAFAVGVLDPRSAFAPESRGTFSQQEQGASKATPEDAARDNNRS
jgi:hypothetical protein